MIPPPFRVHLLKAQSLGFKEVGQSLHSTSKEYIFTVIEGKVPVVITVIGPTFATESRARIYKEEFYSREFYSREFYSGHFNTLSTVEGQWRDHTCALRSERCTLQSRTLQLYRFEPRVFMCTMYNVMFTCTSINSSILYSTYCAYSSTFCRLSAVILVPVFLKSPQ